MPTYRVWTGGDGTAPTSTDWTKAYPAFGSGVTAATTAGDIILVHKTHQESLAADATYTFAADNIRVVSVDKDAAEAYSPMGTGGFIGHATLNRSVSFGGGRKVSFHGITPRTAGATADRIDANTGDGGHHEFYDCYFWQGNTGAPMRFNSAQDGQGYTKCVNCDFEFGSITNTMAIGGVVEIFGGSIAAAGVDITTVFSGSTTTDNTGATLLVVGMDIAAGSATTATLIGDSPLMPLRATFVHCKLPSAYTALGTQTADNLSGSQIDIHDCAAGDTHGIFERHNALGACTTNTGTRLTAGAAGQSWQISTTSLCGPSAVFETPWISAYNSATSAITPAIECLRNNGTATAYADDLVFAQFTVKNNSGFTLASFLTDRATVLAAGTAQAAGAGAGSWTIASSNSPASFKCGVSMTPAEVGHIRGRICVASPSVSGLFANPFIDGL